jgi:SAM-dependent methyltransferase
MAETMNVELPYFDQILDQFERAPDSLLSRAMQRHMHWGLFRSAEVEFNLESCLVATEAMTDAMCAAGRVRDGARILDVGCGFGGTIGFLNDRLSGVHLVGLNIDERQLALARRSVVARSGNSVQFVQGDACELSFDNAEFDVVLAVECIFHFPSRRRFFGEARRVLRTGGTLALSDFVADSKNLDEMTEWTEANPTNNFYGVRSAAVCTGTYARIARHAGFTVLRDDDVTTETMPTYVGLKQLFADAGLSDGVRATAYLEEMAKRGFFQYRILSLEAASA